MRPSVAIASALLLLTLHAPLFSTVEPPLGDDRAGMCDAFDGLAFTFCVALCEARECDRRPIGDERCAILQRGFERVSDGYLAPCEPGGPVPLGTSL
jgi:hypothetical protein